MFRVNTHHLLLLRNGMRHGATLHMGHGATLHMDHGATLHMGYYYHILFWGWGSTGLFVIFLISVIFFFPVHLNFL